MTETVDAIVVGAGQAGPSLAVRLAEAGRRVVLIERERLGGTCVNNGCLRAEPPMARVGRARERGETAGFLRVLVGAQTKRFVGVTLFGIKADEVVHHFIQAMTAGLTYKALMRVAPVHPTVSELIPTLLARLTPFAGRAR